MADFIVADGGTTGVNGTYVADSTVNGKNRYWFDAVQDYWLCWSTGLGLWVISINNQGAYGNVYSSSSTANDPDPPSTGWGVGPGPGASPVPSVTEDAGDTTKPIYASSATYANGSGLDVQFTEAGSVPLTGNTGFTVTVNGNAATISNLVIAGTTIGLTLTPVIRKGDVVTVAYTPGNIADSSSNILDAFSAQAVTNNSTVATRDADFMVF